jgi:hypothetical protein
MNTFPQPPNEDENLKLKAGTASLSLSSIEAMIEIIGKDV